MEVSSYDSSTIRLALDANETMTHEQLELWIVGLDRQVRD